MLGHCKKMNNQNNSLEQTSLVNLNKHIDADRFFRTKNQEETIETILVREFYQNKEYEIKTIPSIFVPDLAILGYKKPEKAVKSLINRGVVRASKDMTDTIELVTKQVYCNQCRTRPVFIWDKEDHLKTFHAWNETTFKHNIADLEFNNKPYPDKIDHDYKAISELKDNKIEVKCSNCGDKRTIYIDHFRECDPFDKGMFIDNPDDQENIRIRLGRNDTYTVLKNQEELKQFIQSKIKEIEQ